MEIIEYRQVIFVIFILIGSCTTPEKPKVFYINSYHEGYGSSDDVMHGIKEVLGKKVDLKVAFMDTKRNSAADFISSKVDDIRDQIENFQPDVIIASDDNAVKFIIEPYYKNGSIPVIYCGVNWSAEQYELPHRNVTGMLEVLPFSETVEIVKHSFPALTKLTVLSENTVSEQKNKIVMQPIFDELGLEVTFSLVEDFGEWKATFISASDHSDIIYIPTNGAIKNWNEKKARQFVRDHISKPVITCDDFMMKYAAFGLTKIAQEPGEWAANAALEIIDGKRTEEIPIAKNQQYQTWFNKELAERIGLEMPDSLSGKYQIIDN